MRTCFDDRLYATLKSSPFDASHNRYIFYSYIWSRRQAESRSVVSHRDSGIETPLCSFFFFSWALQVGPCRAVFLFLFFISRKRPYKLGLYPTIACSRTKNKQTASVRQKGLTSCLVQALQLVKITHICSRSMGVLAALWTLFKKH